MVSQIIINNNEVSNIVSAEFNDTLNEINKAEINLTGQNQFEKNLADIDAIVEISAFNKNYKYVIVNEGLTEDNSIKLVCRGEEEIFVNIDIDPSNLTNASKTTSRSGTYNNVDIQDFFTDMASHIPNWSINSSVSLTIDNYRVDTSMSIWNSISKLCNELGLEIDVDYDNKELLIEQNLGTAQVDTLNERIDFEGVPKYTKKRAKGKKVIVYGKGDGEFQITASAQDGGFTTGDPIFKVNDPNIVSNAQAQKRADQELARLKQNIEHYIIPQIRGKNYSVSDTIIVNSPSVNLSEKELKIVRLITSINGDEEILSVEVTNAEYSRAFKNRTQELQEETLKTRDNLSTKQDSGNTQNFVGQVGGNNSSPLIIPFNIFEGDYEDDAGNIDVETFTFDYDIDVFRQTAGGVTGSGFDADVRGDSGNNDPPVENDTALEVLEVDEVYVEGSVGSGGGSNTISAVVPNLTNPISHTLITLSLNRIKDDFDANEGYYEVRVRNDDTSTIYKSVNVTETGGNVYVQTFQVVGDIRNDTIEFTVLDNSLSSDPSYGHSMSLNPVGEHQHSPGLMNAQNHPHDDGDYETDDNDVANAIVIGDAINDSANVNSTGITWELRFWNGSSFVLKNSGSESFPVGQTFDTDIDISSGGTLPDATGLWRLYIYTNSSDADTIKGKVNIKHNLNNS